MKNGKGYSSNESYEARRRRAAIARDVAALRRYNATNVAPRYVENYYRTMALTGRKPKFADGYQPKWDERVTPDMIIRRKLGADWEALRRRQERDRRFMASFSDPKLPIGGPLSGDEGYRYPQGALFDPTALPKTRVRRPLVAKGGISESLDARFAGEQAGFPFHFDAQGHWRSHALTLRSHYGAHSSPSHHLGMCDANCRAGRVTHAHRADVNRRRRAR